MSNSSDFKRKTIAYIRSGRINKTIDALRKYFESLRDSQGIDLLNRVAATYSFLLRFLRDGNPDPQRSQLLNDIREDLYDLVERGERARLCKDSTDVYYTSARLAEFSSLNFSEALGRYISADSARMLAQPGSEEYKKSLTAMNMGLKDIFSVVWTMAPGKTGDIDSIVNVTTDSDISFSLRATLVGALIMSLLHVYDRAKFNALLTIESRAESEKIRARALVGIALILDRYPKRINSDPSLAMRFETMADDLSFYTRMREVIYSLAKARGGVNYLKTMQDDILPDISRMSPNFLKKVQDMKDSDGNIDLEKIEDNPEWEKMMKDSGIEKKLRRLLSMQSSGADMMLSMFREMSKNFLFNDIDAWFRPFADWEAERLGGGDDLLPVIEAIGANPTICDSDKFAMLCNLQRLPANMRAMMKASLDEMGGQFSEEAKSIMLNTSTPEFDVECYNYARTLFRFFTYFRAHNEFENPFVRAQRFRDWPFIGNILAEKEIMSAVGEYYYRQGFYDDAINVFSNLIDYDHSDEWKAFCLQKVGCSLEGLKRPAEALAKFIEAFDYAPADEWLAKKIVRIAYNLGNFPDETKAPLLMLHARDKDNLRYLLPLARFEAKGWRVESTEGRPMKFIDRAAYIAPDNHEVVRLLAMRQLSKDYNKESAGKALEILRPLVNNAEMYLASLSLSASIGAENVSAEEEGVETSTPIMVADLEMALYLNVLIEDHAAAISNLSGISTLLAEDFSISRVETDLLGRFGPGLTTDRVADLLPLYSDALEG